MIRSWNVSCESQMSESEEIKIGDCSNVRSRLLQTNKSLKLQLNNKNLFLVNLIYFRALAFIASHAASIREHRVYLEVTLNRIGSKSCVEVGKARKHKALVQEKRETQARTFISQITATDAGNVRVHLQLKKTYGPDRSRISRQEVSRDKCLRFEENPLSNGGDIGCFPNYIFCSDEVGQKIAFSLRKLRKMCLNL